MCEADADALHQVLWNLWRNAVDAAKSTAKDIGDGEVRTQAKRVGLNVVLQVSDTGPGVSEAQRERLFEPFFTTREDTAGLGLTIVRQIVASHNGTIALIPGRERGCTVRVQLPLPLTIP